MSEEASTENDDWASCEATDDDEHMVHDSPQGNEERHTRRLVDELPVDVLYQVLLFLPACDISVRFAPVCKKTTQISDSRCLWRLLNFRCLPKMASEVEEYCRDLAKSLAESCTILPKATTSGSFPTRHHLDPTSLYSQPSAAEGVTTASCGVDSSVSTVRDVSCEARCRARCASHRHVLDSIDHGICAALFDCHSVLELGVSALVGSGLVRSIRWKDAWHNLPYLARIAVCDQRNDRVKILRIDGSVLDIFDASGTLQTPSGITLLTNGLLAVTEFSHHRVTVWDPKRHSRKPGGGGGDHGEEEEEEEEEPPVVRFDVGFLPRGIIALPDGEMAVCMFGSGLVSVFNSQGQFLRHLNVRRNGGGYRLQGPSGAALLPGNQIAITECNANRVVVLHMETGAVVRVIGSGEYADGEDDLSEPRGIVYSAKLKCLIVCDSGNERLKFVTVEGAYIREIRGPFSCLASVALLPDEHHAVVSDCDHHRLIVLRLSDGQLLHQVGTGEAGDDTDAFENPRCIQILPGLV